MGIDWSSKAIDILFQCNKNNSSISLTTFFLCILKNQQKFRIEGWGGLADVSLLCCIFVVCLSRDINGKLKNKLFSPFITFLNVLLKLGK